MKTKTCSKCGIIKSLDNFSRQKDQRSGFRPECKQCQKDYREKNKVSLSNKHKLYYILTREKRRAYYFKTKKRTSERALLRYHRLIKTDISFKLVKNLRNRVRNALQRNSKSGYTLELLGCSVEFCKQHLESQFQPGMNWNNYGINGWVIDHIKPCISFDLSKPSEQKLCFHYKNLQPLWAIDHLYKHAKIL